MPETKPPRKIRSSPVPQSARGPRTPGPESKDSTLAKDLVAFFKQDAPDVCVACRSKEFWVNRVFLSARSPVFRVMLQSEFFSEGSTKRIEINDFDPELVEGFLDFLCTDTCWVLREGSMKRQLELYILADKYQIECLAAKCEAKIIEGVRRENVLEVLNSAEVTSNFTIKRKCMEVLQQLRGADMLTLMRGYDIWEDVRDLKIKIERLAPSETAEREMFLVCCAFDTVENLKGKVGHEWGLRSETTKMVFSGTLMEDDRTLQACGLTEGSTVFLLEGAKKHTASKAQPLGGANSPREDTEKRRDL